MTPRFSVIIPAYNAEKTLCRCLDSLVQQPYSDYEILLINDGSTDDTGRICESYANENQHIQYFYKENGGVSSARNLALEHASGEYVLFVDSDDYVSDEYFQILDAIISENHVDLVEFSACFWHGTEPEYRIEENNCYLSPSDAADKLCGDIRNQAIASLPMKALRRELIEEAGIRFFTSLSTGEDFLFSTSFAAGVKTIATTDKVLYHVCLDNGDSLSRKPRKDLCDQLLTAHRELFPAVDRADPQRRERLREAVCFSFYRSAYSSAKELLKYDLSRGERYKSIREICAQYAQEKVRPSDWKSRLISVPIRWRLAPVIDAMVQTADKRRRRFDQ